MVSPSSLLGSFWGLSRDMAITQSKAWAAALWDAPGGLGKAQFLNARKCAMCDWSLSRSQLIPG